MSPSLRTLLTGIIDYAGLFPPARLPLDQAIRNYARYRQGDDSWMLGRFVCPPARLPELVPFVPELFASGPPLTVAALGRGSFTVHDFLDGLMQDLEAVAAFRAAVPELARVDVLEARLPQEVVEDGPILTLKNAAVIVASKALVQSLRPFVEIDLGARWQSNLAALIKVCEVFDGKAGLKLRTGGLEMSAFPTTEQVAVAIAECGAAGVPLKFTAGLHHPLRHFDAGLQTRRHGFINVFVAGVLGTPHQLPTDVLGRLLDDEQSGHFRWAADGVSWEQFTAGLAEIEQARRQRVIAFGSCSFDEPRDDLRTLGWL